MKYVLILLLFVMYSCNTKTSDNKLNSVFFIFRDYSIKIKKDSIGFGKLGDKMVLQKKDHYLTFDLLTVDSVFVIDKTENTITFNILSHEHNTKSIIQTLILLDCISENYFTVSAFKKYKPIGYPYHLGAILSKNGPIVEASILSDSVNNHYSFKVDLPTFTNKLVKSINDSLKLGQFIKLSSGRFDSVKKNNFVNVVVN